MGLKNRMKQTAARRMRVRRISAGLLLSLGTAVFSAAVALIVNAVDGVGPYHWPTTLALIAVGLALTSAGSWLLTSGRRSLAIAVVATDIEGDTAKYRAAISGFVTYAAAEYAQSASSEVVVQQPKDIEVLKTVVLNRIEDLASKAGGVRHVGVAFQGRHHVAFHLGGTLDVPDTSITLYQKRYNKESFVLAQRTLGHVSDTAHRAQSPLEIQVRRARNGTFNGGAFNGQPRTVNRVEELDVALKGHTGAVGLVVNLQGTVDDPGMITPAGVSAASEGLSILVCVGLRRDGAAIVPPTTLPEETDTFEAAIATIAGTAKRMPSGGLLYINGPVAVALALGRLLHARPWTPMRHIRNNGTYERFPHHD